MNEYKCIRVAETDLITAVVLAVMAQICTFATGPSVQLKPSVAGLAFVHHARGPLRPSVVVQAYIFQQEQHRLETVIYLNIQVYVWHEMKFYRLLSRG